MIFGIMSCGKTSPFDADSTDRRSCAKKVESNGLYRRALPPSLPMIQNPGTFAVNFGPAFWTCALFLTGLWWPSSLQAHSEVASLQKTDAETTPRPNIILFVTDDLSPDLGCYGNPAIRTPHIDALAADGVRFRRAFCTTASCSASRSVILTGWFNHANGHYGHQHSYHHFSPYAFKNRATGLYALANTMSLQKRSSNLPKRSPAMPGHLSRWRIAVKRSSRVNRRIHSFFTSAPRIPIEAVESWKTIHIDPIDLATGLKAIPVSHPSPKGLKM
jgi:hypothetical protein